MSEIPPSLTVSLGERSYPIYVGPPAVPALCAQVETLRAKGRRVLVVVDEALAQAQGPALEDLFGDLPRALVPSGEASKNFHMLERLCRAAAEARIDRKGAIFAVGGGVTGDLAGFAAAAYLRGIPFFQVPTTLLAMVDSSVGGKTGINLPEGKNLVGAFHQPNAVFACTGLLQTLPPREFSAGMAEVIKHALIADADLFDLLEKEPLRTATDPRLPAIVTRNCAIKAAVVQSDEREQAAEGGRALLNLGHTFGHAIEAIAGYGTYLHGEAIGVGLVLAGRISAALGLIDPDTVRRIEAVVAAANLPTHLRTPLAVDPLWEAMTRDKKVDGGDIRFVVLNRIGSARTTRSISPDLIHQLWLTAGAHP